jgi:hypothetical protein
VLTFAVFCLGGLLAGTRLPDLPYSVPRAYLLLRNALWAAWGAVCATALFVGRRSGLGLLRIGGLTVLGWYWADRLLFARSDYFRSRWPLAAAVSGLLIAVVVLIGSRPAVRDYFKEKQA